MDNISIFPILPIELLHVIASFDIKAYRALLAIPFFARSLNPGLIVDYRISFGDSVRTAGINPSWFVRCIEWSRNEKLHRIEGPAIEHADGSKEWYLNGERHCEDGPAIEHADGSKQWYRNGQRHREDGPAIEWTNGHKAWYRNGERHREDGPAIEYADGDKSWYLNGLSVSPF